MKPPRREWRHDPKHRSQRGSFRPQFLSAASIEEVFEHLCGVELG